MVRRHLDAAFLASNEALAIRKGRIDMSEWKLLRLELARTPEFPRGSASRAYMLRLPLDDDGGIDEVALASRPALATVRRFWPNEPDRQGRLERTSCGWAFSEGLGPQNCESICHLECDCLTVGACVTLVEPDGSSFPFRVVRADAEGLRGG